MEKTLDFLMDCFQNLSNKRYYYVVFVHENNWKVFNDCLMRKITITPDSFMEGKYSLNIDYKNSKLYVFQVPEYSSGFCGVRCHFCFYDSSIDKDFLYGVIFPCANTYPGIRLPFDIQKLEDKCYQCICKTCAVAQINGGAPGCGNCKDCDLTDGCRSCNDYYNIEPIKNLNKENDK